MLLLFLPSQPNANVKERSGLNPLRHLVVQSLLEPAVNFPRQQV